MERFSQALATVATYINSIPSYLDTSIAGVPSLLHVVGENFLLFVDSYLSSAIIVAIGT